MASVTGYSGKPVWQKLGIFDGALLAVCNPPEELPSILDDSPAFSRVDNRQDIDMLLLFEKQAGELAKDFELQNSKVKAGGMIWVCWPKKSSKVPTNITEQTIRDIILPTGWVDTKVCAVSDVWSGLKFLRRKS
jgi:hypothetical protein